MSDLVIGDLHLTDRPRDDYRYGIFDQIAKWQKKYEPQRTFILGDLTDRKDRHSSVLVNRTIEGLRKLDPPVIALKGNHDYVDPNNPFFKFLNHFEGVDFIMSAVEWDGVLLIPHWRDQDAFDMCCRGKPDMVLCHNTFEGAIAETGAHLSGLQPGALERLKPRRGVWAGDVHRPQRAGIVTYVGTPYHVRFGEDYSPRCVLVDDKGKSENLYFKSPKKVSLLIRTFEDILNNKELSKGDHVKITCELAREEVVEWKQYRADIMRACSERGLEVYDTSLKINTITKRKRERLGVVKASNTPIDIFNAYCTAEGVASNIKEAGAIFLE